MPPDLLRELVSPLVAFVASFLLLRWMLFSGARYLPLDHPNARSLHTEPIPRTGGIAVMSGVFGASALLGPTALPAVTGALALAGISFIDDSRGLSVGLRFAAHLVVAVIFAGYALDGLPWLYLIAAVFAMVWMLNLYNFMDGSDGLVGGMTAIGFGSYAAAAILADNSPMTFLCLAIAASGFAFLLFNFHPARIFMGDVGSIPLGFLAAAIGILGWQTDTWSAWFPILVFSPFIVDATLTLLKRLLRRERIWQAHREHYYQKLVQSGAGHRNTALMEYVLMAACGLSGLWGLRQPLWVQILLIIAWLLIYLTIAWAIDRHWNTFLQDGQTDKR